MKVVLIDSGVDKKHYDLKNVKIEHVDLFKDKNIYDQSGHGTSSAAEILSVNPRAEIISIKVLDEYNCTTLKILISALEYCLTRSDISIINLSLTCRIEDAEIENLLQKLIYSLKLKGIKIICAEPNNPNKGRYFHNLDGVYSVRAIYDPIFDGCLVDTMNEKILYKGVSYLRPSIENEYRIYMGNSSFTARASGVLSTISEDEEEAFLQIEVKSGLSIKKQEEYNTMYIYELYSDKSEVLNMLINPEFFLESVQEIGFKHTVGLFNIELPESYRYSDISLENIKNPEGLIISLKEYLRGGYYEKLPQ